MVYLMLWFAEYFSSLMYGVNGWWHMWFSKSMFNSLQMKKSWFETCWWTLKIAGVICFIPYNFLSFRFDTYLMAMSRAWRCHIGQYTDCVNDCNNDFQISFNVMFNSLHEWVNFARHVCFFFNQLFCYIFMPRLAIYVYLDRSWGRSWRWKQLNHSMLL